MKIAFYEENRYHTEIMGTFLYYFSNKKVDEFTVFNTSDRSMITTYFKRFYNIKIEPHINLINKLNEYDMIIIGTSISVGDLFKDNQNINYDKFVFVCHALEDLNIKYSNVIVLFPLNYRLDINPNTKYILPIHGFDNTITPKKSNILTIVGRFKDKHRDVDDIINLITNFNHLNFIVYIFSRVRKFVNVKLFELQKKYPKNLQIFLKTPNDKLDDYLKQTKFLLPMINKDSWYHKDRLSGNIALAYNYNIPLILDNKTKEIYKIQNCVSYESSITEVIEYVSSNDTNDTNDINYEKLVENFVKEKNKILETNTQEMNTIFDK